jgi:hypothetical protein
MRWNSRARALAELAEAIYGFVAAMKPTEAPELTYDDAIGWFVERPRPAGTARGAILRHPYPDGRTEIMQIFLSPDNQVAADPLGVPYGRRLLVDRIDADLADSFGGTALLIVD